LKVRSRKWPDLRRDCDRVNPSTTFSKHLTSRKWPDLRRDCDHTAFLRIILTPYFIPRKWPDLRRDCDTSVQPATIRPSSSTDSKMTWFKKGLRHALGLQSGFPQLSARKWPDLRRDCDSLFFMVKFNMNCALSKMTWFKKGLRPLESGKLVL